MDARELHAALGAGRDFSNWIKDRIEKYGFMENRDYEKREDLSSPDLASPKARAQTLINYALTISTAKEIAMVENSEQGRKIRQYLIKVEQAWNAPDMVMARALQMADRAIKTRELHIADLERKAEADRPKVEFFDAVADSCDALQMRDVAGVLNLPGMGRNKLFALLREKCVLDNRNIPYREYQDRGYFRVVEQKWTDKDGETHINLKTLVYQRGVDFIRRLAGEKAA